MNAQRQSDLERIERRLRSTPTAAPPADLLEKIRREIPPGVLAFPRAARGVTAATYYRVAAVLAVAVAGGFLTWRTLREDPLAPPVPPPEVSSGSPAAGAPAAPAPTAAVTPSTAATAPRKIRPQPKPSPRVAPSVPPAEAFEAGELADQRITVTAETVPPGPLYITARGVPGGVPGGVVGGVHGGTPGGVVSGAAAMAPPSTGGTAEPNDQPYGDMFFRAHGTNPFVDTEEDRLSTFGLDVDTGSYGVARAYLRDGHLPPAEAIRVEEFVNAFRYADAAPAAAEEAGADFTLVAEGAPSPFAGGERHRLLRFHLRARAVDPAERLPAVLTFVVDVSGSMAREDRLGLVQRALGLLLDRLRPEDRVGLVVYGDRGEVRLRHTADHERLRRAIDELAPEGATNAEDGLRLGYDLAAEGYREGALNRVILCSDGVANVGSTGPESILERIGEEARRGVELTTVGFGMGNYNDVLMEQLADRGNGRYAYVDDLRAARRIFVEELTGTLQTVAADAKAQVEFDPRVVERWRLLGYENRDLADERFRDDRVDAGEIGAGHEVTALYEVKLRPRPPRRGDVATLRLRYRPVGAGGPGEAVEIARALPLRDLERSFAQASPSLRLAAVAAEFAEVLKGSYWARGGSLAEVARRAAALVAEFPGDERVAELAALTAEAARAAALNPR